MHRRKHSLTTATSTTTERLEFAIRLDRIIVLSKHVEERAEATGIYVKWRRGRSYRGKLPSVPCDSSNATRAVVGGVAVLLVRLPDSHEVKFEVNMHMKGTEEQTAIFAEKNLDVEIFLIGLDTSQRTLLFRAELDLREWLRGVRVGVSSSLTIPFNAYECLHCTFTVQRAMSALEKRQHACTCALRGVLDPPASEGAESPPDVKPAVDFPFQPLPQPQNAEDVLVEAGAALRQLIDAGAIPSARKYFSPLVDIVEDGVFRAFRTPLRTANVFDALFSATNGRFPAVFHHLRGDREYPEPKLAPPWRTDIRGAAASRSVEFLMRLGNEKFCKALETAVVVAIGQDLVLHVVSVAPSAPVVGGDVRLEAVIHVASAEGGCTLAMYLLGVTSSTKAKILAGGRIGKHVEKAITLMMNAAQEILLSSSAQSTDSLSRRRSFRSSISGKATQVSLDPNLWRRLSDTKTLPHENVVLDILERLQRMSPATRCTESMVQTLENVMVFHRMHRRIVLGVCNLLIALCRICGVATIAAFSSTLGRSIHSVLAFHSGAPEIQPFQQFLDQLSSQLMTNRERRRHELLRERDPWLVLERNIGDQELVEAIVPLLLPTLRGAAALPDDQVQLISAILTLHMQNTCIVDHIFQVLYGVSDLKTLTPSSALALQRTYLHHREFLGEKYVDLYGRIEERIATFSFYEFHFLDALRERPVYEATVLVEEPFRKVTKIFLTRNFLCIGSEVVALNVVRRVERFQLLRGVSK